MSEDFPFLREDVFPSWFANRIQDFLSAAETNLRLSRKNATTVQVIPDAALGIAAIAMQGRWRFNEASIERAHPGGAKGTYIVWAVGEDNDVDEVPKPHTDHTNYAFDLRITSGANPSGAGVEVFEKIGEIDWSGTEIEALRQTLNSVTGAMLANDALPETAGSDVEAIRQPGGGYLLQLKKDSVGANELADNSVDTAALVALAVTEAKVAAEAITSGKIAALAVTNSKIGLSAVGVEQINNLAVATAKIAALAVTEEKLAGEAVSTAKIKLLAVTSALLAAEAVTEGKIANLAVASGKLANLAVIAAKLGEEAVETAKIKALAVTEGKIAGEAVANAKLAALAVTAAKLAEEGVETSKLKNLAVTAAKLAAEAVETGKIANLAVTAAKLAAEAVETGKIKNLAVTEGKLADGAVSSRKFKPTVGFVQANAALTLAGGEQDVPGATVTLNVAVESKVIVNAFWEPNMETSPVGQVEIAGRIVMDALAQFSSLARLLAVKIAPLRAPLFMTHIFTLTPGEHTIKLTASTTKAAEAVAKIVNAQFTYMVVAV